MQALFSHPNLKAITLQQPLADAMILGKKKVRVLGRFVIHAHCLRTSAGGWWCGQPPAATRPTVFKNALGHKSLGEGWLAAECILEDRWETSLWEKAACTWPEVSGRRLACCRPSSRSSLLPSSEQLCARSRDTLCGLLPKHGQETPTSAQAEPSSCSEEVYYPPPSSCVLGCRNTVRRRRH